MSVPANSSIKIEASDEQFPTPPVKVAVNVTGTVFGVIAPKVPMKSPFPLGPISPLMGVKVHPGALNTILFMFGVMHPIMTTTASFVPAGV